MWIAWLVCRCSVVYKWNKFLTILICKNFATFWNKFEVCSFFQFKIAVAWLTLFDVILLILLIPVMDKIIYPWIRAKGWNFSMETRILVGLCYSLAAIIIAGIIEYFRLHTYWTEDPTGVLTNGTNCCYEMVPQMLRKFSF